MRSFNLLIVSFVTVASAIGYVPVLGQVARPTPVITVPTEATADSMLVDSAFVVEEIVTLPTVPEALLRDRLPRLEREIPLPYNKVVHHFIDHFTFRKPGYTRMVMERMPFYFPLYEKTLAKHNMPDELKYLSIVESALNPKAMSRVGAGGLWQFMPYTGKDFNLQIDEYTDDRMDPGKATEAACRYLKDLYRIFNDWEMALAAYNCGPGAVRRAMRRTGGTTFWTCYDGLPKETRSYVPQFIAIAYMMNYGSDHGIVAERPDYPIAFDTVQINTYLSLKTFANLTNVPLATLQKLNPAILSDHLPDYTRNFSLRIPSEEHTYLLANRKQIMDSASRMPILMENSLLAHTETLQSDPDKWQIASLLAEPLALPDTRIAAAEYQAPEPDEEEVVVQKPRKITHMVRTEELDQSRAKRAAAQVRAERERTRYHRVQPGDTLWNIAQKYGNISIDKLKKMNRIKGNSVRPGQKLVVG